MLHLATGRITLHAIDSHDVLRILRIRPNELRHIKRPLARPQFRLEHHLVNLRNLGTSPSRHPLLTLDLRYPVLDSVARQTHRTQLAQNRQTERQPLYENLFRTGQQCLHDRQVLDAHHRAQSITQPLLADLLDYPVNTHLAKGRLDRPSPRETRLTHPLTKELVAQLLDHLLPARHLLKQPLRSRAHHLTRFLTQILYEQVRQRTPGGTRIVPTRHFLALEAIVKTTRHHPSPRSRTRQPAHDPRRHPLHRLRGKSATLAQR